MVKKFYWEWINKNKGVVIIAEWQAFWKKCLSWDNSFDGSVAHDAAKCLSWDNSFDGSVAHDAAKCLSWDNSFDGSVAHDAAKNLSRFNVYDCGVPVYKVSLKWEYHTKSMEEKKR